MEVTHVVPDPTIFGKAVRSPGYSCLGLVNFDHFSRAPRFIRTMYAVHVFGVCAAITFLPSPPLVLCLFRTDILG